MNTTPKVQEQVCIAPYTSMRVGGTVRYLYQPETQDELVSVLSDLQTRQIPFLVIGNASNLLFPDEGYDGAVILTGKIREITMRDGKVVASCGASMSSLATFAQQHGKGGLSFAYGIPGTVGGGVYMNAGAYGGEIADCLAQALCIRPDGTRVLLSKEQLHLSYRKSLLQEEELYVLEACFDCPDADPEVIKSEMERNMQARRSKQPLEYPSCGSAFKRPEGHFAGALIEQAGLKGLTIGGAQVSEKHAGFIINIGGATATDVKQLISAVQDAVLKSSGVRLEPEIRILPLS